MKPDYTARVLMLFFRLNANQMNYTPLSFRGRRAARLLPKLKQILEGAR